VIFKNLGVGKKSQTGSLMPNFTIVVSEMWA